MNAAYAILLQLNPIIVIIEIFRVLYFKVLFPKKVLLHLEMNSRRFLFISFEIKCDRRVLILDLADNATDNISTVANYIFSSAIKSWETSLKIEAEIVSA